MRFLVISANQRSTWLSHEALVVREPLLDRGMFVRAVVIQDEMNGPAARRGLVELLQKTEKPLMPVAAMTCSPSLAAAFNLWRIPKLQAAAS